MFNIDYIKELLNGKLTANGYKHFIRTVYYYAQKYKWPKTLIISSEKSTTKYWTDDESKELTHQFFEWIISRDKLRYIKKIPDSYISYYFAQMLMSFIADKIKEFQLKQGISFEKVKELVSELGETELCKKTINSTIYYYLSAFNDSQILTTDEVEDRVKYIPKIPINEETRQYKPLVRMAISDIFDVTKSPISLIELTRYVYSVFDQRAFMGNLTETEIINPETDIDKENKHSEAIEGITKDLTKNDAKIILEYIFQTRGEISLSDLSAKYNTPKSTLHHKIESFKRKIVQVYVPESEEDGLAFINKLASFLDDIGK